MRWINEDTRAGLKIRHEVGSWTGYAGLATALLVLLATTSEGTPFARDEKGWVVFGFMVAGYLLGWAIGPVINRLMKTE